MVVVVSARRSTRGARTFATASRTNLLSWPKKPVLGLVADSSVDMLLLYAHSLTIEWLTRTTTFGVRKNQSHGQDRSVSDWIDEEKDTNSLHPLQLDVFYIQHRGQQRASTVSADARAYHSTFRPQQFLAEIIPVLKKGLRCLVEDGIP